ncbi:MAG: hypothetical protein ABR561_08840, partial [Guyparkeria sp.]
GWEFAIYPQKARSAGFLLSEMQLKAVRLAQGLCIIRSPFFALAMVAWPWHTQLELNQWLLQLMPKRVQTWGRVRAAACVLKQKCLASFTVLVAIPLT